MMVTPWPQWTVNSFLSAKQPQFVNDESAYYGPYMRLLCHLFGVEGSFEINPHFDTPPTPLDATDVIATFTVEFHKHPVFFIQVKPPASFALDSMQKQADERMRNCFRNLRHRLVAPRLPGISAFGTRMAFYEYVAATNSVTPPAIAADPVYLNGRAPADRWDCDILEPDGIARMRQVASDVKAMCQAPNI